MLLSIKRVLKWLNKRWEKIFPRYTILKFQKIKDQKKKKKLRKGKLPEWNAKHSETTEMSEKINQNWIAILNHKVSVIQSGNYFQSGHP